MNVKECFINMIKGIRKVKSDLKTEFDKCEFIKESEKVLDQLAEISLDQKSEYLGYSLYYSVYLFVYLVCSLHDRKAKYNAMKLLQMEKMQKLYERFAQYRGNKLHRLFVLMAKYRMNSLALLIMQCIRAVRKKTQVSEFWRSI